MWLNKYGCEPSSIIFEHDCVSAITAEDEQVIERLRKIGAVVDELPVWPFDAGTLRKFFAAYVIPVMGSLFSLPVAKAIIGYFGIQIPV